MKRYALWITIVIVGCGPDHRSVSAIESDLRREEDVAVRARLVLEMRALGRAAIPAWIRLLEVEVYDLHRKAAQELGNLQAVEAIPVLTGFLVGGFPGMRLRKMSVVDLATTEDESRAAARLALVRIGGPAAEPVRRLLTHENPRVRHAAIVTLSQIGVAAAPAAHDVCSRLKDEDGAVVATAAFALAHLRVVDDTVLAALGDVLTHPEIIVVFNALTTIQGFRERALPLKDAVRRLTEHEDVSVKALAIDTIRRMERIESGQTGK